MTVLENRGRGPSESEAIRRKRLGQYFTDGSVARLLAALARAPAAASIVDPMVGRADMLLACAEVGATPACAAGIEIDPRALEAAADGLSAAGVEADLVLGSAFSVAALGELPQARWDLVITNPPYVRYQIASRGTDDELALPDGREVRAGLLELVDGFLELDGDDRRLFRGLAGAYSGLADLAVPAWLLAAALVDDGGRLAMVVPTTWLSREYSLPIRYLLARAFEIECVVEDGDASWFKDALVRTALVVARRVPTRDADLGSVDLSFPHVRLTAEHADEASPVGRLFHDREDPAGALAEALEGWRVDSTARAGGALVNSSGLDFGAIQAWADGQAWLRPKPKSGSRSGAAAKPGAGGARPVLHRMFDGLACCRLEDLGWAVGQGLRTGANDFFYVSAVSDEQGQALVRVGEALGGDELSVPSEILRPALRRQAELPAALQIREAELGERLLDLGSHALPEDIAATAADAYDPMPDDLAGHVRLVAGLNLGSAEKPRRIPELSAVCTNVRRAGGRQDLPPRFWYQLPPLRPRHRPALLMARINNLHPRCYLNPDGAIVDANFSTLWPSAADGVHPHAMAAVLNSSWTAALLETQATVLGGGALKVEAAHLRRLPIPEIDSERWSELEALGARMRDGSPAAAVLDAIDSVLIPERTARELVREICSERLEARSA